MTTSFSLENINRLHLRGQGLTTQAKLDNAAKVVKQLCGVQAQELPAAFLSIRARSTGLTAVQVEQARLEERSFVRTWGMRGTLHLLPADDLEWLIPLLAPVFIAGGKRRRLELGLDDETCKRGIQLVHEALAEHGTLTRAELVTYLAGKGLRLEGQATPHLLFYCAFNGLLCFGAEPEGEPTYVLLNKWLANWQPSSIPLEKAYTGLTLRYLAAYAPARPEDMAGWSGLPLKAIRKSWGEVADQLQEVQTQTGTTWILKSQAKWLAEIDGKATQVSLLPRYDTYLLGYHNRDLIVPPQYAKRVNAGGGIIHPTIVVDGQAVGIWKTKKYKNSLELNLEPFEPLSPELQPHLESEANDIARFLGTKAKLLM
jgi:Winged helix DNA-binding domain